MEIEPPSFELDLQTPPPYLEIKNNRINHEYKKLEITKQQK